ncbi:YceI family protein [Streptomyces sp. NPDC006365]|uniref:YceI family protein n=1 Tax=Streptomyces sp. NPDC006365 TaxID=3364744 RepID=UPI0036B0F1DE
MSLDSTATRPMIPAGTYMVDPSRTTVRFAVKKLWGLVTVRGTFDVCDGTIVLADDPADSSVRVTMAPDSFATGNQRRDQDVTGKHFLDVAAYPAMTFASTSVESDGSGWTIRGLLTTHGVTAPVTLRLVHGRTTADGCAFTATAVVDRTAFGVSRAVGFIGRELAATIEIGAKRTGGR